MNSNAIKDIIDKLVTEASSIILGKDHALRLAFACLLARGHLLIEDLPGVGKTTLAHVLARLLGLEFSRIQFTSDMLPADILGISIYERDSGTFHFHPGPIFSQLVLADEINRATPKTQSALLEAMEEGQITVEGQTHALPSPFFVIATQNPTYQIGTFPLPESQLDRFLMRVELGYPDQQAERALLASRDRRELVPNLATVIPGKQLVQLQVAVDQVHVSEALLDYLQDIIAVSRQSGNFVTGLSPRAGLAILKAARAWALMEGREHVLPDDIQTILPAVVAHRLRSATTDTQNDQVVIDKLLAVPVP
ncbi:MAG: MoxR family ATPase [Thioalkalispiraceae bacterium]|jgi:MoxR-like ATPase